MRRLKPKSMIIAFIILSIYFIGLFYMMGNASVGIHKANKIVMERVQIESIPR